jgi:alpha-glucosidase (family GH31 glycosyl hydrolase)
VLLAAALRAEGQTRLGPYTGHTVDGPVVSITAAPATVRLTLLREDLVRVDVLPGPGSAPESSFVVLTPPLAPPPISVADGDSALTITTPGITVVAGKFPLRLRFFGPGGELLAEPADGGPATLGVERSLTFALDPAEHLYGSGLRGPGMDRRGQIFELSNRPVYGYTGPEPTMSINVPALLSTRGYGIYVDVPHRSWMDAGAVRPDRLVFRSTGGELTYYVFHASGMSGLLDRFAGLTGRAPMPPRWAFGFIQSRFGYRNEQEARAVVDSLRNRRIPADALVLDLYWFRFMGDLTWNAAAWPAPFAMMSEFRSRGIRTVVITEPYLEDRSLTHGIAAANGWLGRTATGQPYPLTNWWSCGCTAGLVDLTDPGARAWFWSLHPPFLGAHVAGLWTDLGEPERHPDDMVHTLGRAPAIHNIYNLLWARTVHDGLRTLRPGERVFNLTRAGFAGIQRYGASTWSGDVARTFGGLAAQPAFLLSMGLSGIAYHTSDIGGFCCGTTTPELYVRWMQFGAFSPLMRAHGTGQDPEPWAFGPQAEAVVRRFIELRYELLPYTYTLAAEHHRTGMPLARPLFLHAPPDPSLADETGTYFWGDALLVAPVLEAGRTTQPVRVPPGRWFDFWTDEVITGGGTLLRPAPLDRIPLLVRAGSIIPMLPVMQHTGERPPDTMRLAVYPAPGVEARYTLYEDDGSSTAYEQGAFTTTLFRQWTAAGDSGTDLLMSLGAGIGSHAGQPAARVYRAEVHAATIPPSLVRLNGAEIPRRASPDDLRAGGNGWYHDSTAAILYMQAVAAPESSSLLVAEDALVTGAHDDGADPGVPQGFRLELPYPNPFNPATSVELRLPAAGVVHAVVVDLLGREVDTLAGGMFPAGSHTLRWDARGVASGTYFIVVRYDGDGAFVPPAVRSVKVLAVQ